MILFIDNYDSFVHNLARYFVRLGQETRVVRNDEITACDVAALQPDAIVLSPGPCTPQEAGCSVDVIRALHRICPILGVCLGHQAIGAAFGAATIRAPQPMHGRSSAVRHRGQGLFKNVPNPMIVGRYHSLMVDEAQLSDEFVLTHSDDGVVMAMEHREYPLVGVQFHPESILTRGGYRLLANFLDRAAVEYDRPQVPDDEMPLAIEATYAPPTRPVTF
jgi:anthranilate synthase/aminodeoxychorismate synthase-like glutamine amidotransferase